MLARYRGHFHTTLALDKIDHQFSCTGFMSVSNLTGLGCKLRLSPCWRVSKDISIPLQLCCGSPFNTGLSCKLCLSPCWRISKDILILLQLCLGLLFILASVANCAYPHVGIPLAAVLLSLDGASSAALSYCLPPTTSPSAHCACTASFSAVPTSALPCDVPPSSPLPAGPPPFLLDSLHHLSPGDCFTLHHLTRNQLHIIWHQRLWHIHLRRVSQIHAHSTGIPNASLATDHGNCPSCTHAKLCHHPHSDAPSHLAPMSGQGISIDLALWFNAPRTTFVSAMLHCMAISPNPHLS